jgi:3-hydroxyisobutyrate dehydrogenase
LTARKVFTSLPGQPELEAMALGEHGLLARLAPGTVYLDLLTHTPGLVRPIHEMFRGRGAHVLWTRR